MSDVRPQTSSISQVDDVLQGYLDQLLITATEDRLVATTTLQKEVVSAPVSLETLSMLEPLAAHVQPVSSKPTALASAPSITLPTPTVVTQPAVVEKVVEQVVVEMPVQQQVDPIKNLSAQTTKTSQLNWESTQGIECLIFKVAGLKLAIPLPLLGGVYTVNDKVTPLIGQAPWSMGVWQGEDGKLTIIDSAQLIMPERGVKLRESGYNFFIQLDRSPWALACQEICDTVTLVRSSIKWRGDASQRPWLAGTVISEMCALVDVPGVMALLEERVLPRNNLAK